MHSVQDTTEDLIESVFYSKFKLGQNVLDTTSGRKGTISKVWGKELITKYEDRVTVSVEFSYSIIPTKQTYNNFRCIQSELALVGEDDIAF